MFSLVLELGICPGSAMHLFRQEEIINISHLTFQSFTVMKGYIRRERPKRSEDVLANSRGAQ